MWISLDLNYRRALSEPGEAGRRLRELIPRADAVFATEQEARLAVEGSGPRALAAALAALGPRDVLVKRGAEGVTALCEGVAYDEPARRVAVVDPVGAGDAFAAGYLAELMRDRPVPERLATACAAGACAVAVTGDWEGLPSRADLALLQSADDPVDR